MDKIIKSPTASNNGIASLLKYTRFRPRVKFGSHWLKQEKVTYTHGVVLNFYIVYEINLWPLNLNSKFSLLNLLFDAVKLTKNVDPDNYFYSEYGIGFDKHETWVP